MATTALPPWLQMMMSGQSALDAPTGGALAQGGPQFFDPQRSNVGTGKEVGPWTNPATDAQLLDPSELQGASQGDLASLIGKGNPYLRALLAVGQVIKPTATATDDQAPTNMWNQRPSGVLGPQPSYDPLSSIQAPAINIPPMTAQDAGQPARPYTPTPAPQKGRIDPAKVDMGMNPRFTTIQYQDPNSLRNAPIYTALNLGGSS